ncbi:hypothetical protein MAR_007172 [Mya arenaria]|uniref:Uncharacterized protein n=1 Tax=Mya arenaria TaxID=6604 RepID=A0ABY7DDL3_MYAAR|nr:hypothetical protein MAR_007172 [Mya arenaria]
MNNSGGGDGISRMGSSGGSRAMPGRTAGYKLKFGRSRVADDDDYFDDDHDEGNADYLPAPGSPGAEGRKGDDSDSDDPLDAFMADIEKKVQDDCKPKKVKKKEEK